MTEEPTAALITINWTRKETAVEFFDGRFAVQLANSARTREHRRWPDLDHQVICNKAAEGIFIAQNTQ